MSETLSRKRQAVLAAENQVKANHTVPEGLTALLSGGKHAARRLKRAQILLAADAGASDDDIATSVGVGGSTVYRTKQRFVFGNLEAALNEAPRPGASVSSRAKRKLCWLRRPVPSHRRAAPVGPWNYWRVNWSSLPLMTVSPARPWAGVWPKTTSSPGARTGQGNVALFNLLAARRARWHFAGHSWF